MTEFNNLSQLHQVALLFIPFVYILLLVIQLAKYISKQKLAEERNSKAWPSSQIIAAELNRSGNDLNAPLSAILPSSFLYSSRLIDNVYALIKLYEYKWIMINKITHVLKFFLIIQIITFYICLLLLINNQLADEFVTLTLVNFYALLLVIIIISGIEFMIRESAQATLVKLGLIAEGLQADVNLYLFLESISVGTLLYMFIPKFVSGLAHKPDSVG